MPNYRNPNGYGSVTKLSGRRRKPYAARKTVGYDDRAYPVYAVIGYYQTRKDALQALSEYNQNPYDLSGYTFEKLYKVLTEQRFPKMSESLQAQHRTSYTYCKDLYQKQYKDLRQIHFQQIIDSCGKSHSTQKMIRNFLVTMDKLAYDMEIVTKMRTANLTVEQGETQLVRTLFTHDEVETLWKHQGEPFIDETLFLLYTGCRAAEMVQMKCADVDLEQGIMRGGLKTAAGKNRVIPIHDKIKPIIERHLSEREYLFLHEKTSKSSSPDTVEVKKFDYGFKTALKKLSIDHRTHDCRHSFRTKMDGANKVCIDLIMGHKTGDVGERVYTHKTVEELKEAIKFLQY